MTKQLAYDSYEYNHSLKRQLRESCTDNITIEVDQTCGQVRYFVTAFDSNEVRWRGAMLTRWSEIGSGDCTGRY